MKLLPFFLVAFFPVLVWGQDLQAIVNIEVVEEGTFYGITGIGTAYGSGTVIGKAAKKEKGYLGYILTAAHVVTPDENSKIKSIKVNYANGESSNECRVLVMDKDHDVAIIYAWIPDEISPVPIGDCVVGDILGIFGRPDKAKELRERKGRVSMFDRGKIYIDAVVYPGDSGGPIFFNDQVVGVISGGWFWIDGSSKNGTWPTKGCGPKVIKELLSKLEPHQ